MMGRGSTTRRWPANPSCFSRHFTSKLIIRKPVVQKSENWIQMLVSRAGSDKSRRRPWQCSSGEGVTVNKGGFGDFEAVLRPSFRVKAGAMENDAFRHIVLHLALQLARSW